MSSFLLTGAPVFPAGTVLKAYSRRSLAGGPPVEGQSPGGAAVTTTAVVANTGLALFEGLEPESQYWAGAEVAGRWEWKGFRTEELVSSGGGGSAEALPVVNVLQHGISGGDTDWSVQLQALINETAAAGGGILHFPKSGSQPWYRFLEVSLPSNVWISQHPQVEFRPPTGLLASNKTVLNIGEFGALGFATNISSIGPIKVNISEAKPHGATLNLKAVALLGVYGCKFPGFVLTGSEQVEGGARIGTEQGTMFTMPNAAGLVPTNCTIESVIATKTNCPGGGAIQLTAHKNLHVGYLFAEGGIAARVETDSRVTTTAEAAEGKARGSDGLSIDTLVCEKGFCPFSLIPHTNYIRGETSFGSVTAKACSGGGYIGPGAVGSVEGAGNTGPLEGVVTIRSLSVDGAGGALDPEFGNQTQGLFYPNILSSDFKTVHVNIGSLTVKNVTGNGLWIFPNLRIGVVEIENAAEHGMVDRGEGRWEANTYAKLGRVRLTNCCSGGATHPAFLGGLDRLDIESFEAIDTRGAKNRMSYGMEVWSKMTVNVDRIRGEGGAGGEGVKYEGPYIVAGATARLHVREPNAPAAAYRKAVQAIPKAVLTKVELDTVVRDDGGNIAGGAYVAPSDGWYQLDALLSFFLIPKSTIWASIMVAGVEKLRGQQVENQLEGFAGAGVTGLVFAKAGQAIELGAFQTHVEHAGQNLENQAAVEGPTNRMSVSKAA